MLLRSIFSEAVDGMVRVPKNWLKENWITRVAMESTGIYWKPVFNLPEDSFFLHSGMRDIKS
jgi:hypothetical protein